MSPKKQKENENLEAKEAQALPEGEAAKPAPKKKAAAKPEGERIVYDPYARQMVPGWMYHLVKFFYNLGYGEKRGPGVMEFLIARDRYIDDFLQECLDEGIAQLVILGAGLDSRKAIRPGSPKQPISTASGASACAALSSAVLNEAARRLPETPRIFMPCSLTAPGRATRER